MVTQESVFKTWQGLLLVPENKHVQTTHAHICPTEQGKIPPASTIHLAHPSLPPSEQRVEETVAAHQEKHSKRPLVISGIMAHRLMLYIGK